LKRTKAGENTDGIVEEARMVEVKEGEDVEATYD